MSSGSVTCPRCGEAVEELRFVPPDVARKEVLDEIEGAGQAQAETDGLNVCSDCLADIDGG